MFGDENVSTIMVLNLGNTLEPPGGCGVMPRLHSRQLEKPRDPTDHWPSLKTSEKSRNQGWVLKRRQDLEMWRKEDGLPVRVDLGGARGKGKGVAE